MKRPEDWGEELERRWTENSPRESMRVLSVELIAEVQRDAIRSALDEVYSVRSGATSIPRAVVADRILALVSR